jgi:hypothetical protein
VSLAPSEPLLRYRSQPKQRGWHGCPAYESGYGGAKFGGKSLALLMEGARYSGHPRYRGVIFRRTYPHLSELMDRAWSWFPGLGAAWNGDEHAWRFPSGARLLMRHCQYEHDKENYQGHEYHFMGFDQLEQFTESQYTFLLAQNRSGVPDLAAYARATFNPGGIGHAWVKARFVDRGTRACAPWRDANEQGEPLPSRCFHFATIDDNPAGQAADPGYRARLHGLPEQDRRALLYGDWDVFAGQVFRQWRRARHVIEPFKLPAEWRRWRAVDYGTVRPFVCLWLCQDPGTRRVYVYREVSRAGVVPAAAQARMILEAGPEPVAFSVGDPAMWIRQADTGKSIAAVYGEAGVSLRQASNDRLSGLSRVRDFLADGPDGEPLLQVFSTCTQLIRNLPALVHDEHNVEDVDTDGPDDEYDALRYGLMATHRGVGFLTEPWPVVVRAMGKGYRAEGGTPPLVGQQWRPKVVRRDWAQGEDVDDD